MKKSLAKFIIAALALAALSLSSCISNPPDDDGVKGGRHGGGEHRHT
ncbi:MAG: hypothetical protein ACI8UO_005495 [Verrucomicrobiales bacterium]|jgi:hypothetical protein